MLVLTELVLDVASDYQRSGAYLRRGAQTFRVSPAFATSVKDGLPLR